MELKVKIIDPVGLHARPAAIVAQEAAKFESNIMIKVNGKEANLKSIMSVMALGVKGEDEITIVVSGSDETQAITSIEKSLKDNKLIA